MDAIISDLTGKVAAKSLTYIVDIYNRSTGFHLEIDGTFDEFKGVKFDEAIKLALQNNKKWYKLTKPASGTGKWDKIEQN